MKRTKALIIIAAIYILAFLIGAMSVINISNLILKMFVFDVVATVVVFAFSLIFKNSSVYDPYWSLTPIVIAVWVYFINNSFSAMNMLFLIAFVAWGLRLTINWGTVFYGFDYEDWRYRMFRENNGPVLWFIINFGGIHMFPTLIVFAGMLPIFEIAQIQIGVLSVPGIIIILLGILLELLADRDMQRFLKNTHEKVSCREGLWKNSRHPNYLGEISVWIGVFLTMLPYAKDKYLYGLGALAIAIMFNVVSIPMMEKRQKARRSDYEDYCQKTSRLLLLPVKITE